jgi:hypothetical protein
MLINFSYLNSLNWKIYIDNYDISFESENNEYIFNLYYEIQKEGIFSFFKETKMYIYLDIINKENNVTVTINNKKTVDLWTNLTKEVENERQKMYKEIDL